MKAAGSEIMDERLILNKYLPVLLFALCIAIAIILAWAMPTMWPAAIAIAIAGAAFALTMKVQQGAGDTSHLNEEIAALNDANEDLRIELANTHAMMDELADVVEQLAANGTPSDSKATQDQLDGLRTEFLALRTETQTLDTRVQAVSSDAETNTRFAAIENRLESLETATPVREPTSLPAATETGPLPSATEQKPEDSGKLRSLITKAQKRKAQSLAVVGTAAGMSAVAATTGAVAQEPSVKTAAQDPLFDQAPNNISAPIRISLTPVFKSALGAPIGFQLLADSNEAAALPELLLQAQKIAQELADAGRDVQLFMPLSTDTLSNTTNIEQILATLDSAPTLRDRLTFITTQVGLTPQVQLTLSTFAARGCMFALENIIDWSLDLSALSRDGLRAIIVDGLAMAQSAQEQGGDPKRLVQALEVHNISLIAGNIPTRGDIDTVRALQPALVMGDGLGAPRFLDDAV